MILAEVRDYLAPRGRAPLTDLAARFDVDAEAVRAMLDHLDPQGPGAPDRGRPERVRRLLRLRRQAPRGLRVGGPGPPR